MYSYHFSFLDIIAPLILLPICYIIYGRVFKNSKGDKYFMLNMHWHVGVSIIFTLIYLNILGGGDTLAYFNTIKCLNNLALNDFVDYIIQLKEGNEIYKFNYETGRPPGWIFREEESFFVCQVFSFIGLFSFNSIIGLSILTGLLSSICSWYFYSFVKKMYEKESKLLAFGALFVPSVGFWCSGVSKDTLVYNLVLLLIVLSFKLFKKKRRFLLNGGIIVFLSYLLISTRSIIFYSYLVPFAAIFIPGLVNLLGISRNSKLFLKFVLISGSFMLALSSIDLEQGEKDFLESNDYLMQASMTQQDFASNESYGENKYSLGEISFTPLGLLQTLSIAVLYGVYSPFLWDALSPTLILNGLESVFFGYLLLVFVFKRGKSKLFYVFKDPFLLYCFVFVITLAFITGFTSVLYGVLVRLRCPLLPLLVFIMDIPSQSILPKKNS